jgi:hypothetical protein
MIEEIVVRNKLKQCWSLQSSSSWTENNPARGQCGVTSLVIQDYFGGDILKTRLPNGQLHFYNRIDSKRIDFTDEQFAEPIAYLDQPASRAEAYADTNDAQYKYLSNTLCIVLK